MSNKTNLIIDAAIFAAFLVAFEPNLTGIAVHEWLSLALAGTILIHLLVHWRWLVRVTRFFFRNLFHATRLNYVVDTALLVAFITLMLSGVLISRSILPTLGIELSAARSWRMLHSLSANASLALVGLHFGLHWRWIVGSVNRYVVAPMRVALTAHWPRPTPTPAAVPVRHDEER